MGCFNIQRESGGSETITSQFNTKRSDAGTAGYKCVLSKITGVLLYLRLIASSKTRSTVMLKSNAKTEFGTVTAPFYVHDVHSSRPLYVGTLR